MGLVASNRVFDLLDKDFVIEDEGQNEEPLKGKAGSFDKVFDLAMSQKRFPKEYHLPSSQVRRLR